MTRTFTGMPAVRASIPLWLGLYGPSGSGKTYSALRLARGIKSVCGGKIAVGDTESGRALHYADEFDYTHYPFDPPFGPLDYQALLEQMAGDGVTIAIIDSASHEHEGPGGVLEMHEEECERLAKLWNATVDAVKGSGWIKPKRQRLQMIDAALRTKMHIIWCFRAQNKMDFRSKKPVQRGFMPIGGEVLVFQMVMTALLLPGAKGRPTWQSKESGEREMIKLPHWAQKMLRDGRPLDEELGAALAKWAKGDMPQVSHVENELAVMRGELGQLYDQLNDERRARLTKAIPSREAIQEMPLDRVQKGIEVLRQAVQQQKEHDQ